MMGDRDKFKYRFSLCRVSCNRERTVQKVESLIVKLWSLSDDLFVRQHFNFTLLKRLNPKNRFRWKSCICQRGMVMIKICKTTIKYHIIAFSIRNSTLVDDGASSLAGDANWKSSSASTLCQQFLEKKEERKAMRQSRVSDFFYFLLFLLPLNFVVMFIPTLDVMQKKSSRSSSS